MDYTIGELARLAGVSTRTLRLYDQMDLLKPVRDPRNGYRLYGAAQVDRLQHILFYREMGMSLEDIAGLLSAPDYDPSTALEAHYQRLLKEQRRLSTLLLTVQNTLNALKGGTTMTDVEKFEGFKRQMIDENEAKYGAEIRTAYGDDVVNAANERVSSMSHRQWCSRDELGEQINQRLKVAVENGGMDEEAASELCRMHREWLCMSWPEGMYTPELHRSMAATYLTDERFKAFYDGACGEGAAALLAAAVEGHAGE